MSGLLVKKNNATRENEKQHHYDIRADNRWNDRNIVAIYVIKLVISPRLVLESNWY